ncbi:hypothetical protein Aple_026180 [Acrocarpospora pleiomorpha]|uniref:Uncharacterized protein n=1 Tax=Acrocarpospora pleiomorpha TaxID=90975 RepID=A0A5M3XG42_9ACTN|nr:hypothetical protein [Acrocarpospora pleiomorpha]GES19722.1 hypothetical protein Aple_026180 [Acrocarpospora pleiomorpha]
MTTISPKFKYLTLSYQQTQAPFRPSVQAVLRRRRGFTEQWMRRTGDPQLATYRQLIDAA